MAKTVTNGLIPTEIFCKDSPIKGEWEEKKQKNECLESFPSKYNELRISG